MSKRKKRSNKPMAESAAKAPKSSKSRKKKSSKSAKSLYYIGLIAALLGGILYLNTLGHDYTLDDYSVIKDNTITKRGVAGIPTIFKTEYRYGAWSSPGSLYRPLTSSMFALEWQLSPDNPTLGHVMNVILYALTGWMLWVTWRRVLRNYSPYLTAMAVLFFMAHPIHTEVVANIKSRDEILALLFVTSALYALWRHFDTKKMMWLTGSVFLYGLALFSKESSITFLAVFPLCVWFFREKMEGKLLKTALFALPAALYLGIRHAVLSAQNGEETYSILDNFIVGAETTLSKFASAVMMCGVYLSKLIFPLDLVSDKGYPQMQPVGMDDFGFIFGFLLYAVAIVWALMNLKKKHFLSFAILFYMVTFSLFSNVFMMIGTSYGERVLYLPSLGFSFALAWFVWYFIGKKAEWGKAPVAMFSTAAAILLLFSVRTITRNPDWKNSATLYTADLKTSPNCAKLNYHNGLEEANQGMDEEKTKVIDTGQMEKAIESYSKAIELYPTYHDAYGGRGLAYFRLGQHAQGAGNFEAAKVQYQKALKDYEEALKYRPNDAKVLSNMGFIYFQILNDKPKAEEVYRKALKYDPRFADARRNLGAVLALSKRYDEAIVEFKKATELEPDNATLWLYLGYAYRDKGDMATATPYLEKAYQMDPRLRPKG